MIYTNGMAAGYSETTGFFRTNGVSEANIEKFIMWMNMESEREYSVLGSVEIQDDILNNIKNYEWNELGRALGRDAKRKKLLSPDEWTDRWILFAYKLVGYDCGDFVALGEYLSNNNRVMQIYELIRHSFCSEKSGLDETDAGITFIMTAGWKNTESINFTAEMAQRAKEKHRSMAASVAAVVLDRESVKCDTEERNKACRVIESLCPQNTNYMINDADLLTALCEVYYSDTELFRKYSSSLVKNKNDVARCIVQHPLLNRERCMTALYELDGVVDAEFVEHISRFRVFEECLKDEKKENGTDFAEILLKKYPDRVYDSLAVISDIRTAELLIAAMKKYYPDRQYNYDIVRQKAFEYFINQAAEAFGDRSQDVLDYIYGRKSFAELEYESLNFRNFNLYKYKNLGGYNRYSEEIMRTLLLVSLFNIQGYTGLLHLTLFDIRKCLSSYIDMMVRFGISAEIILFSLATLISSMSLCESAAKELGRYPELLDNADLNAVSKRVDKVCYLPNENDKIKTNLHIIWYLYLAQNTEKNREVLFDMSERKETYIKNIVINVFSQNKDLHSDVVRMLSSKKADQRELALAVIEKSGTDDYREDLAAQYEKDKSSKVKEHIAAMLGIEAEVKVSESEVKKSPVTAADAVAFLTKGQKTKKIAWLFDNAFSPVHDKNGNEVSEDTLKALMICFAAEAGVKNPAADLISADLNESEFNVFVFDVLGKWLDLGADAKSKWILYFVAYYGGNEAVLTFVKLIKDFADNMRGAIAGEAVKALAFNGSSEALITVDNMSRKYKNKQVRRVASEAMNNAADILSITREELADRIVPDLGFDENMCRTFDYGRREFKVYITRDLKTEVYNGEKKIKDLPKPGVNDDAEKAEKAYAEYKEMKKLMKTVVATQTARLEYVLMCDRKWTKESFGNLFIKNPVMHCFAEGLIWGIYDNNGLVRSFRYMEDGSFTTSDEDEFEIPDNSAIGLVHPVELTEEERSVWTEQLSDYEITQPFEQLARKVYFKNETELDETDVLRFSGSELNPMSFHGKMTKFGWDKGCVEDAGMFYTYDHWDVTGCTIDSEGKKVYIGYEAELKFSGMYVQVSYEDNEDIDVEELVFYKFGTQEKKKIRDVNPRYFSEIIRQIQIVTGSVEE